MMGRGLFWVNRLTILILILIVAAGGFQVYSDYSAYGSSWKVTTIIGGVESTRTVSIYSNVLSLMILMGATMVLLVDSCLLVETMPDELERRLNSRLPIEEQAN